MKKIVSLILAMLMLALPAMGLASGNDIYEAMEAGRGVQATVSFRAGDITGDQSVDSIIKDVLDALKLSLSWQTGENAQAGAVVSLSGKEILTFDAAAAEDAFYLLCNLLGEEAVMVKPEDMEPLMNRFIDLFAQMGALSSAEVKEMKTLLAEAFAQGFAAGSSAAMQAAELPEIDMSEVADIVTAFVEARTVEADVTAQPRNSDPAAKRVQVTFTGEDMVSLWTQIIDEMLANAQLMEMINANVEIEGGMTAEEALEQVKSELSVIPEMIRDDIVLDMYLDEKDEPVYATTSIAAAEPQSASSGATVTGKIGGSGSSQGSGVAATVTMDMNYARLTLNDAVTHAVNVIAKDAQDTVALSVNVIDGEGRDEIRLDMGDAETSFAVNITKDEAVEENAKTGTIAVNFVISDPEMSLDLNVKVDEKSQKNGVDATAQYDISVSLGAQELFGMTVDVATGEPEAAMATENAIRLAEISEEDFQAWFADVAGGLQGWAVTVVQALPASVLMLLMGQ